MDITQTNSNNNEILVRLQSSNSEIVSQALDAIKIGGTCEHIVPMLDLLLANSDIKVENKIFSILADIRDENAVPIIMQAIVNTAYKKFLSGIISACWQSNLDFSNYFTDFITVAINEDYMTAFESFTVIEEIIKSINSEKKQEQIKRLKYAVVAMKPDKQSLISELIHLLSA